MNYERLNEYTYKIAFELGKIKVQKSLVTVCDFVVNNIDDLNEWEQYLKIVNSYLKQINNLDINITCSLISKGTRLKVKVNKSTETTLSSAEHSIDSMLDSVKYLIDNDLFLVALLNIEHFYLFKRLLKLLELNPSVDINTMYDTLLEIYYHLGRTNKLQNIP